MARWVFVVLMAVVGLARATQITDMDLVGRFNPDPACPLDDPACVRPEPTGVNVTVWHGDRSCTIVWLYCELDRFIVTVDSPAHLTHHSFCALGNNPTSREDQCCKSLNGGVLGDSKALSPHRNKYPILYSSAGSKNNCGTATHDVTSAFGTQIQQYTNKIELIEFLEQKLPRRQAPSVSLISHTHINIQCCNQPPVEEVPCNPPGTEENLEVCTEKQFTFTCTSNEDRESFHCFVALKDGESLQTEDVGYTLDRCVARPVGQAGDEVVLFANGAADSNLQLSSGVCGDLNGDPVDKRIYSIEGPWIQWGADTCDLHRVEVDCTVKVVPRASLPPLRNDPDFCRSPPFYVASRAGFFQPGKLTVVN
ncbi:uncharacterized protein LOC129582989 [Paramacrobiotus metropolitanus]|uniref:uncharacterized protein LOC129582989 n=1 Tax=Paramacrobiotus metropolitanus TaxID=2943436 RepID=UPI002445D7A2|nr:uncharacterized protein LOC129582989 [Paramacrobiotus metropolitanus]